MDPVVQATIERAQIRNKVKDCKNCELCDKHSGPIPFSGSSHPRIVVVGEAPGREEDKHGTPFYHEAPSGYLIRRFLRSCDWYLDDQVAFVNAVSCFPNRTPTPREVTACLDTLTAQLDYLECDRLLVLGGIAVQSLLDFQIRIGDVRGHWFQPDRLHLRRPTWALATWHPAAVLRNPELEGDAWEDISYFSTMVQNFIEPQPGTWCLRKTCWEVDGIDYFHGLPYCKRHMPQEPKK